MQSDALWIKKKLKKKTLQRKIHSHSVTIEPVRMHSPSTCSEQTHTLKLILPALVVGDWNFPTFPASSDMKNWDTTFQPSEARYMLNQQHDIWPTALCWGHCWRLITHEVETVISPHNTRAEGCCFHSFSFQRCSKESGPCLMLCVSHWQYQTQYVLLF